jgi:hypothetical protein
MTRQPSAWSDGIEALRAKESKARADGVNGILAEFGAAEAHETSRADGGVGV